MHLITKQLKKWLHLLLLVTLLGSLLLPAPLTSASALNGPPPAQSDPLKVRFFEKKNSTLPSGNVMNELDTTSTLPSGTEMSHRLLPTNRSLQASNIVADSTHYYGAEAIYNYVSCFRCYITTEDIVDQVTGLANGIEFKVTNHETAPGSYAKWNIVVDFGIVFSGENVLFSSRSSGSSSGVGGDLRVNAQFIDYSLDGISWTDTPYDWGCATGCSSLHWLPEQNLGNISFRYLRLRTEFHHGDYTVGIDAVRVRNVRLGALPSDQTYAPNECPFCGNEERQHFAGLPINTFSGNYNYQATDFAIAAVGQLLRFERTYNSLPVTGTVVYSQPLGYGWTHNHDLRLTFAADPGGEPNTVILKAPHGSRMRFSEVSTGTYQAFPGVWASLTRSLVTPFVYTITAANQESYSFDSTGRLTRQLDPQGNATDYTYNGSQQLTRVTDAASGRYLNFSYNSQGQLG